MTAISKRLRFEVFRRDNHACRYCGASAPAAVLTVDHVIPVALGGTDDPGNLVAACSECNGGKSSASPDAAVIADVSADAVRWGQAIREAAEILQHEMRQRDDLRQQFLDAWTSWTYGPDHKEFPLPAGWGISVDQLLAAGLPIDVLCDCVDIAMSKQMVKDVYRYMCGIAWRKVAGLREVAAALVESDGGE